MNKHSLPPTSSIPSQPVKEVDPFCRAFALVVRRHRERMHLSPGRLAERSHLSRTMIEFIEAVGRIPTMGVAVRVARALGVQLSRLTHEAERMMQL